MRRAKLSTLVAAAALAALSAAPARAEAQAVFKKIREQAVRRVEEHKAKVDSSVVRTAAGAVDSTLDKTGRAADAVVSKVGGAADTAISRTEHGVRSALKGGDDDELAALSAQLGAGHAVLRDLHFAPNSDQLDPSADAALARLAKALLAADGVFIVEGHTDPMATPAAAQALSEQRAKAVKARLVAGGVPAARLLAVGYGATRPAEGNANGNANGNARIELTRAQ